MKAQQDVLSGVIIIAISVGLVSSAYMWGMPLIEKRQDITLTTRLHETFDRNNPNSLARKIEDVALYGGVETFTLDANGLWKLYPCSDETPNCDCSEAACATENNSIQFSFLTKVSPLAIDFGWIPNTCGTSAGLVGEPRSIICGKATRSGEGFELTFKTWFRELVEDPTNPSTTGYKIVLYSPTGSTTSTGNKIRISRGNVDQQTINGKKLINYEVKILFI